MWDADKFEVKAIIKNKGRVVATLPLTYAGKPSQFSATYAAGPGVYEATIYAYDAYTGNTGVDKVTFIVKAKK